MLCSMHSWCASAVVGWTTQRIGRGVTNIDPYDTRQTTQCVKLNIQMNRSPTLPASSCGGAERSNKSSRRFDR